MASTLSTNEWIDMVSTLERRCPVDIITRFAHLIRSESIDSDLYRIYRNSLLVDTQSPTELKEFVASRMNRLDSETIASLLELVVHFESVAKFGVCV